MAAIRQGKEGLSDEARSGRLDNHTSEDVEDKMAAVIRQGLPHNN